MTTDERPAISKKRQREKLERERNLEASGASRVINANMIESGEGWCSMCGAKLTPADRPRHRRAKSRGHGVAHGRNELLACGRQR